MDIDKFAAGSCDFCNDAKDICLSCKKIIMHEAIKSGISDSIIEDLVTILKEVVDKLDTLDSSVDGLSTELFKARKDFDDWIYK